MIDRNSVLMKENLTVHVITGEIRIIEIDPSIFEMKTDSRVFQLKLLIQSLYFRFMGL